MALKSDLKNIGEKYLPIELVSGGKANEVRSFFLILILILLFYSIKFVKFQVCCQKFRTSTGQAEKHRSSERE